MVPADVSEIFRREAFGLFGSHVSKLQISTSEDKDNCQDSGATTLKIM